jgi:hypothetical protein
MEPIGILQSSIDDILHARLTAISRMALLAAALLCTVSTGLATEVITTEPLTHVTSVGRDMPAKIDPSKRYVLYVHGRIIENQGLRPRDPQYGVYEYVSILERFEREGFVVVSEARPRDTDVDAWARHVADQVHALLHDGVPPERITVIGASKGAVIAMMTSTFLANRQLNFVLLADCNDDVFVAKHPDLHGNILSIYDEKDEFGHTCQRFFDAATGLGASGEIVVHLGIGHALLYRPMKEWVGPAVAWARSAGKRSSG